ncbi:hypothetical protein PHMEG_00039348 [Phytophthora megakarya]|uniref:Uncharacterized protein n=1 Tax=Phytophthora megakarya TaxID=4795 RepID=A0A225UG18_9STRA|nr:hypothetical protein PHMEG_00039348 [Phytophthora megakarya]
MPSLGAFASSLCLMLLAFSTSEATTESKVVKAKPTIAETNLLYEALGDLSVYSPDIDTFMCGKVVSSVKKRTSSSGITKYKFSVYGCVVGDEYVGRCLEYPYVLFGNFDVFITSDTKTDSLALTSVKLRPGWVTQ